MRKILLILLSVTILLGGCGMSMEEENAELETTEVAEIHFPDGDPETAACLGSYTAPEANDTVVATVGEKKLTNRELQAWYWAEVAQYRQSGGNGLDATLPLDWQACDVDDSVATWQQYFLQEALDSWHTAQALLLQGEQEGVPVAEPTYNPIPGNYAKYMDGMPAVKVLEGYYEDYHPNSMHQAYLDALPETLEATAKTLGYSDLEQMAHAGLSTDTQGLLGFAQDYNKAYMYFTSLSYLLEPEQGEVEHSIAQSGQTGEQLVTFRHILLDDAEKAWSLWNEWEGSWLSSESTFASLAYENSQDEGTAGKGGIYRRVSREQIPEELAAWCLAPERVEGETTVLETPMGFHVVYFISAEDSVRVQAEEALLRQKQADLLLSAREEHPISVSYGDIVIKEAEATLSKDAVLYPDIAHERFPDVPLYLQQDYPGVMYGGYQLKTNGCGITSFAMLASYMADEPLTPPYMCEQFGRYSLDTGTDSGIFRREGGAMDCFQIYSTYDWKEAREYLRQGYPCIVLQHKGYWTRGGHYLVLECMDADGLVQVRDSNLFNYSRIRDGHLADRFSWDVIHPNSSGYWVFEKKDITTGACSRCGTAAGQDLCSDYLCLKCTQAILRRDVYLNGV